MEILDKNAMTQLYESTAKNGAAAGVGTPAVTFRALLEQFEATGETRIIAHQRDGIAELGVTAWAMRALELDSYMTAKKRLMEKEGLTRGDLNNMAAAERAVFEARVFDHLRDDMANGVKRYEENRVEEQKRRLYRIVPIPDPA